MSQFSRKTRLLLLEDIPALRRSFARILEQAGCEVYAAASLAEARGFDPATLDIALLDIQLPDGSGTDFMRELRESRPELPIIMMTGKPSVETAVAAVRGRAVDYLVKPVASDVLRLVVAQALENTRLRSEVRQLRDALSAKAHPSGLVGSSAAMTRIRERIATIAPAPTTVLILGETGTGKELVARALHDQSGRAGNCVAINCAALPENLLEAELFGFKKGSFTGAVADRKGLVAEAENGTLFLDEIGEMPSALQAKLLRLLQSREYRVIGENKDRKAAIRVLAATHCDLRRQIAEGRFREDLFWRLAVVTIEIPPLRERLEEIEELALHFLSRHAARLGKFVTGFSASALAKLRKHSWPGNARELENVIERAILLCSGEMLGEDDIEILAFRAALSHGHTDLSDAQSEFTGARLAELLQKHAGNVSLAASEAGRNRSSFYTLLRKHGIDPGQYRGV